MDESANGVQADAVARPSRPPNTVRSSDDQLDEPLRSTVRRRFETTADASNSIGLRQMTPDDDRQTRVAMVTGEPKSVMLAFALAEADPQVPKNSELSVAALMSLLPAHRSGE